MPRKGRKEGVMNTVVLSGVTIIATKDQPAVAFEKTNTGTRATFRCAEEIFDPAYQDKKRMNNYFIDARGYMAERVNKMKLQSGSKVNITCRMDFSLSVLDRQEVKMSKDDSRYGAMRYVRGLKMDLIDIGYASLSGHDYACLESQEVEAESRTEEKAAVKDECTVKVKTINLDECNILTRRSRRVFRDE